MVMVGKHFQPVEAVMLAALHHRKSRAASAHRRPAEFGRKHMNYGKMRKKWICGLWV